MFAAPWPKCQVRAFRYDAFEAEPAGVLQDRGTIMPGEMLVEANGGFLG
jgi:hypothetical protein